MDMPLLYHTTSISNAYSILKDNCLKPSEEFLGVSFSRNKREKYGIIQLIINRHLLSYNYKIDPFMAEAERSTGTDSSEEVVTRRVDNLLRYLYGVDITDDRSLRLLIKKLDRMTRQQIISNEEERNTIHVKDIYNLYLIITSLNIPTGERLTYLLRYLENKLMTG